MNNQSKRLKIFIVAGGTGGHVFPAHAVAMNLIKKGHSCTWIGRGNSLESNTAQKDNIEFFAIKASGLRGRAIHHKFISLYKTLVQCLFIRTFIRKHRPNAIIAFGGYTSVAAGLAAKITSTPLLLHEQNSFAGSANRLLARWACCVCCGFPNINIKNNNKNYIGNPVRKKLLPSYYEDSRPLRILVFGGSLGAASLNAAILDFLGNNKLTRPIHLVHQSGTNSWETTVKSYYKLLNTSANGELLSVRLQAFLPKIFWYYNWCDMIICRSGAITLAEVCMAGKYAILVPFPHATDNHQFHNAESLVKTGGANVIVDNKHLSEQLAGILLPIVNEDINILRPQLYERGNKLLSLAKPDATEQVVSLIEKHAQ